MNKFPDEKPKRKQISKKLRFEVFKRDSFTCQYCGRKAPDVVLEVDHITPIAEGGKNTMLNLITSCQECNRGKGKILLTEHQTLEKERKQLEDMQKRKEQLQMMFEWQNDLMQMEEEQIDFIEKILCVQDDETTESFTEDGRSGMRRLINRFGFETILESAKIAKRQYADSIERYRKLGGIAWNITHKDDNE